MISNGSRMAAIRGRSILAMVVLAGLFFSIKNAATY
jgi:hypothetical protein